MRQARVVIAPLRADFVLFLNRSMLINGTQLFCCYPCSFDYARGIMLPFKGIVVMEKRWKGPTSQVIRHIVANAPVSRFNTSENTQYIFQKIYNFTFLKNR